MTHKTTSTHSTPKPSRSEIIGMLILCLVGGGILFVMYEIPQFWAGTSIYTTEAPNTRYRLSFISHGFQDRSTELFIEQAHDVQHLLTFDLSESGEDTAFYWIDQGKMFSFVSQGHEEFYDSNGKHLADIAPGYGHTRELIVEGFQHELRGRYLWRIQELKYRRIAPY